MTERGEFLFKKLPKPVRFGLYSGLTVLGIASTACLPSKGSNEPVKAPDNLPNQPVAEKLEKDLGQRFLDLPFSPDPQMKLVQGRIYSGKEVNDGGSHDGIDYVLGSDPNNFETWSGFPILAAAGGKACTDSFLTTDFDRDGERVILTIEFVSSIAMVMKLETFTWTRIRLRLEVYPNVQMENLSPLIEERY